MYNPVKLKLEDVEQAYSLMHQNPFAILITVANGKPVVSQVPMTVKRNEGKLEIIGHLARGNPHSKALAKLQATVVFQGPHTYVTPVWYAKDDVPTWNYLTVHASGPVELIEDHYGIVGCLKELVDQVEHYWPSGWKFFIPEDLSDDALAKNIVGFQIKVEEISFKKKLSQNRSAEDFLGVVTGLASRKDENSLAIQREMKNILK